MKVMMVVAMVVVLACGSKGSRESRRCHSYCKYEIKATNEQAKQACNKLGGRLASPMDEHEDKKIKEALGVDPAEKPWKQYWISGTDEEKEGTWVNSDTGKELTYTNFKKGEPNNDGGNEDCICVSSGYFGWIDCTCSHINAGYVCEYNDCLRDGTPRKCPSLSEEEE